MFRALAVQQPQAVFPVFMSFIQSHAFTAGKYFVTPMSRPADGGRFTASVSIRSGHGSGTHDRVYTFTREFAARENALRHAAAQGRHLLLSTPAFG